MPIKNAKTIQFEDAEYKEIEKEATLLAPELRLNKLSQRQMVMIAFRDYVSHRKNKAKREKRNG